MNPYHSILTLDYQGQPHRWTSVEEAIILKCKGLVAHEFGEDETLLYGGIQRVSGKRSSIEVKNIIMLNSQFKHQKRKVPVLNNRNLFGRDKHTCGYCGRFTPDAQATRDHIVPVSRGGKDTWTNVVTACRKCNNHKDDHLLTEVDMELLYVPYVPDRAEELILSNRKVLADQLEFLRAFLPKHSRQLA